MKLFLGCRGGGVKSAVSIGVIRALQEAGIPISGLSGSSIGACIAALAACGFQYEDILSALKDYVMLASKANRLTGGNGSQVIEDGLRDLIGYTTFKEVSLPLYIPANQGGLLLPKSFIFSKETTPECSISLACRASASFPFIYEHLKIGTRKFWDGGMVVNPYLPPQEDSWVYVCSSFRTDKKPNYHSLYSSSWLQPEKTANFTLLPNLGALRTMGGPDHIQIAYEIGYFEAKKRLIPFLKNFSF